LHALQKADKRLHNTCSKVESLKHENTPGSQSAQSGHTGTARDNETLQETQKYKI